MALVFNFLLLCLTSAGFGQASTTPMDSPSQLLRSVEKAWVAHDLAALGNCYSDEALLIILPNGAVVSGKQNTMNGIKSVWENVMTHRFTDVSCDVTGDLAWFWATIRDERQDGARTVSQWIMLAVQREGQWRMCFGMPALILPRVFVEDVLPGAGQNAGVERSDAVIEYNGELVSRAHSLARRTVATAQAPQVDLTVLRNGHSIRLHPQGGRLGLKLREAWVAAPDTVYQRELISHPAVRLVRTGFTDLMEGNMDRVKATLSPHGFLMPMPTDNECRGRTRLCSASNLDELLPEYRRTLAEAFKEMDVGSIRVADVHMVTAGKVAVVGAKLFAKRRDTGQEVAMPAAIDVFVEQDGEWSLAASLPLGMEIVPASGGM